MFGCQHEVMNADHFLLSHNSLAWISAKMTVAPVIKMESDPKVDGILKLYSKSEYGEAIMSGTFISVESGHKLIYSWNWEGTEEDTKVDVTFQDNQLGSLVSIIHSGFTSIQSKDMHDSGWDSYFKGLEAKIKQTGFY
ncbi:MAG: SRPBCC domain-containing protein [Spirochaetota bacterium]